MEPLSRLLLKIYDSAQHCSPSEFSETTLISLKKVMHFDSGTLVDYAIGEQDQVVIETIHLHRVPIEKLHEREFFTGVETLTPEGTLNSRDIVLQAAFAQRGTSVIAATGWVFRDDRLLDYCQKYDNAHSLVLASPTVENRFSLAALWRADRKRPYGRADAYFASHMLLHVFEAKKINARLQSRQFASAAGATRATAFAAFDGRIYVLDPVARTLLQSEWEQWSPPLLPRELMSAITGPSNKRFTGKSIVVEASVQDDLLCLVISARADNGKLTTAENRVAHLAAMGMQYKEIARHLDVSPATVRNQLHLAYKKLGVSNKTSLAGLLGAGTDQSRLPE
jgi:DNA-binding NarL/FixJ family response regulator